VIDRNNLEDAHIRIDAHEQICALRWGLFKDQIDELSHRMWTVAGATISLCVIGIATLVVLLITRQHV
jgi:hypothetical protein